jgi:hypothetical protein
MLPAGHNFLCRCRRCGRTGERARVPFERVLRHHDEDTPEAEYEASAPEQTNVRHAGQLKLLCSELEFLLRFGRKARTVVYAGAAPGMHIPKLAELFGRLRFVLIDPAESALEEEGGRIRVLREPMTNELAARVAEEYGRAGLLFVSDVRTPPVEGESEADHQRRIQADMDAQMGWHHLLDPMASMLKFRLPWGLPEGRADTVYLNGEIHLPIFGRPLTHETRLVVQRGARHVPYDHARYERQMAFFNRHQRPVVYYWAAGGLCYDCTAFRALVGRYFRRRGSAAEAQCEAIESDLRERIALWADRKKNPEHRTLAQPSEGAPLHPCPS